MRKHQYYRSSVSLDAHQSRGFTTLPHVSYVYRLVQQEILVALTAAKPVFWQSGFLIHYEPDRQTQAAKQAAMDVWPSRVDNICAFAGGCSRVVCEHSR